LALAFAAVGCGDDGPSDDADASRVDAQTPAIDASAPDADPLALLQPGDAFTLSTGNDTGQDEDPAILRASDGSLYAAWYSNRNGMKPNGREDKEIFLSRTTDGATWTTPVQISGSDEYAFYPALAQDGVGTVHAVWWQVRLIPNGCTPSVDCTGTDNRIRHASSTDGVSWDLDGDTEIAGGPGDWLPSIVYDQVSGRLLVYFAAVVRDADGNTDFGETTMRIYVVIHDGNDWSAPARLIGVNPDESHNTYPHVIQDDDGDFAMTWTRYDSTAPSDVLQVIMETSTETMYATSADGVTWSTPVELSGGDTEGAIDVFPWLHTNHAGDQHYVTWLSATMASAATWEMPVNGTYPDDRVERDELEGYTARVVATATPGVFFGAWVEGDNPTQSVVGRLFSK
jgi:hypothetical protein